MNTTTTTLSTKYQVVIPKAIRKLMGLRAGATVYIQSINDHQAILTKEPLDYVEALSSIGTDTWKKLGGVNYIKKLRKEW
jgi:AbrB family looped-hinge helix DNA binding protein